MKAFWHDGAKVCVTNKRPNDYFVGDLADEATLDRFTGKVITECGHGDNLVNNAM